MAKITVLPAHLEFDAVPGETLMGAANARGFYWPTTCGGQGLCTTCLSEVIAGGDCLVDMGRSERKTLVAERGATVLAKPLRLACQAIVRGGAIVVVNKPGVRAADAIP